MTWKRRGGRKVIIAPDGGDAWAPAKPRPDETLIRALARAHRWKRMLEEGRVPIGWRTGRGRGRHPQLRQPAARLTLLAPEIVEAILRDGSRKRCSWRTETPFQANGRSSAQFWQKSSEAAYRRQGRPTRRIGLGGLPLLRRLRSSRTPGQFKARRAERLIIVIATRTAKITCLSASHQPESNDGEHHWPRRPERATAEILVRDIRRLDARRLALGSSLVTANMGSCRTLQRPPRC